MSAVDTDPWVVEGYVDSSPETEYGDPYRLSCRFGLLVGPDDGAVADVAALPCIAADDVELVRTLLDVQQGDRLRVTGTLEMPRTAGEALRLHVTAAQCLARTPAEPPLQDSAGPLPDDGEVGSCRGYLTYTAPDQGRMWVWSADGVWVDVAVAPDTAEDLITRHETGTPAPRHPDERDEPEPAPLNRKSLAIVQREQDEAERAVHEKYRRQPAPLRAGQVPHEVQGDLLLVRKDTLAWALQLELMEKAATAGADSNLAIRLIHARGALLEAMHLIGDALEATTTDGNQPTGDAPQ